MQIIELKMETVNVPGVGNFGTFYDHEGQRVCCTVEREWLNNRSGESCVPAGVYELVKLDSPKYGPGMYHLHSPDLGVYAKGGDKALRSHCLFHVANFPKEVKGCVGVGTDFHPTTWGVVNSKVGLANLMDYLDEQCVMDEKIELTITRGGL